MLVGLDQPIVAIATPSGRGAVGIVRVSGKSLSTLIEAVCGLVPLVPRYAKYLPFLDAFGEPIDHGLALYFPGPHSFTGEDVLELQAHGGAVVLQLLVERCLEVGRSIGLRLAQPGEFTQRAYLNDKIDLAQAEAVSDLIDASTEAAARSASRALRGDFSIEINSLLEHLVKLRMLVEATLDFPEEDIDLLTKADAFGQFYVIEQIVASLLGKASQGALLREGMHVVLAGQPNVGKSSLLNVLAEAEVAIVTPVAGTTRDKVTQTIQVQGIPIHVVDTAGLRATQDQVESIGVARSWDEIGRANVVLFLRDLTRLHDAQYLEQDLLLYQNLKNMLPQSTQLVHVFNKSDVLMTEDVLTIEPKVVISAQTGAGLEELRQILLNLAGWHAPVEGVFIARTRHVNALRCTHNFLKRAKVQINHPFPAFDLFAEDLRAAHGALSEITGQFTSDDLLGEIFRGFCIGK
jgi:tRNA modification GTPase